MANWLGGAVAAGVGIAWATRSPDAAVEIATKVALLFVVVVGGLNVLLGFVILVGYVSMQNEWLREWVGETDVDELLGENDG